MINVYKKDSEGNFWHTSSHTQMVDAKEAALRLDANAYIEVGQTEEGAPILELDATKFEIVFEEEIQADRIKPAPVPTTSQIVMAKIVSARQFGEQMISEMAAENVLLGITQAGKTNAVRKASSEVINALQTGSLYDAIAEIRAIPSESKDAIFLSDARLLVVVNKIETYLELPHSESL